MTDPSKTYQELQEENFLLKQRIDELEKSEAENRWKDETLRERIKELNCLYSVADIIESTVSIEDLLQRTANQMPHGWYYPEHACARITWNDKEFKTANFLETEWRISADIIVRGKSLGVAEVRYLEIMPDRDEGPFVKEERRLVNAIAERLGGVIERMQAEEELRSLHMKLQALWNITSIADSDFKTICDHILMTIVRITRSEYGFYGFINDDESVMTIHAWSGEAMKDCGMVDKPAHFPIREAGIWGEAVRLRRPFLLNDYAAFHPAKKGYPEGHVLLTNLLVVPFFFKDRIIAVAAAANRKSDYVQDDVNNVTSFLISIQSLIERMKAEEALRESEKRLRGLNVLQGLLLPPNPIEQKLKLVTETVVRIVGADFARIWMIKPGDRCKAGCIHAQVAEGPHTCRLRYRCLHLMASSGRYTHTDGRDHGRVPFGCYKIGKVAAGEEPKFLTNDVTTDPRVHNHAWAKELGLVSFAGYRLVDTGGTPLGVLALFSKQAISAEEDSLLEGIAHATCQVLHSARAEAALRESEERFRRLAENAQDVIYRMSLPDGKYEYVSPAAHSVFGYSPEEYYNTPILIKQAIHPDWHKYFEEQWTNLIKGEMPPTYEYQIIHKSGHVRWLNQRNILVRDDAGNPIAIEGIVTDITERKREEEEKAKLEAQTRLLQKAESLGRMAGAIAHHFNNILGAVIGNLELAMKNLPQGAGPIENLIAAMQAAEKAAEVSGLMLTYLGQASAKLEPLDLSEACRRSLPMLRAAMPGKVVLETDLPSPGPAIRANANQMQQVLTNLITNAWEAVGEDGGSIHLRVNTVPQADIPAAHCYPLNWQPQENAYACLEVTDAGCGIADKDIEKLFDPFFTSKFTGRGLGLSVVLGIVRAHGGAVTVESKPGKGSAFRVYLPVSAEEVPRQLDKEAQAPEMQEGGTVLLVEDEEMVRDMAAAMLKSLGFAVIEAKDGVEAVEVFRQCRDEIRCVLCDLTMPRMNGWETLTALRKLASDVPVILTSGYDKAQVMAGDHPEWPQAFLDKPYRIKELSNAISQTLINRK